MSIFVYLLLPRHVRILCACMCFVFACVTWMWFQGLNLVKFDERTVETAFADVCFALPSSQPPFTPYCCLLITLIASGTLLLVRARRFSLEVKDKVRECLHAVTHTRKCATDGRWGSWTHCRACFRVEQKVEFEAPRRASCQIMLLLSMLLCSTRKLDRRVQF